MEQSSTACTPGMRDPRSSYNLSTIRIIYRLMDLKWSETLYPSLLTQKTITGGRTRGKIFLTNLIYTSSREKFPSYQPRSVCEKTWATKTLRRGCGGAERSEAILNLNLHCSGSLLPTMRGIFNFTVFRIKE